MKKESKVIDFERIIEPTGEQIDGLKDQLSNLSIEENKESFDINDLLNRIHALSNKMNVPLEELELLNTEEVNIQVDEYILLNTTLNSDKFSKFPKLSTQDTTICILAGTLSILIDVIFVGTPDIVKIYKGGENFDGSIFTNMLRKIGNNESNSTHQIFKWFSDKCKVPYDISLESGILTPDNHRLRSLAHDPYFGLLFAVADILLGTTTCIDNSGNFQILFSKKEAPTSTKWLSVIYYLGHIISDISTARGIPIPGFFISQFFTDEISNSSVSKIAEDMYKNGYDLRHLASMSVPVFVKDSIIDLYLKLTNEEPLSIMNISEREKYDLDIKLKNVKMKFISNLIATTGNTVKFIAPPSCGNPTSINIVQWSALIKDSIIMLSTATRDSTVEEVMFDRKNIDLMWEELLNIE